MEINPGAHFLVAMLPKHRGDREDRTGLIPTRHEGNDDELSSVPVVWSCLERFSWAGHGRIPSRCEFGGVNGGWDFWSVCSSFFPMMAAALVQC